MLLFVVIALLVWTGMHALVFWRLSGLPLLGLSLPGWALWSIVLLAWSSFPLMIALRKARQPALLDAISCIATTWLGILFLIFACLLLVELLTLGGWVFSGLAPTLRAAAFGVGILLSLVALVQGHRAPVLNTQEITLPNLPRETDGLRLLLVSDLHLGAHLGASWLKPLVDSILAQKPDLIVVAGDLVDNDASRVLPLVPELARLRAPLGVWAVQGNHDVYGGPELSAQIMRDAGFTMLRDSSALAAPGLRIAGVDDLGIRARIGNASGPTERALASLNRGREACIFVSHTPESPERAAQAGAGLMLSGHTHGGQIWPFNFLVATRFKTVAGAYRFGDMTLFVSRGAGTWGPRMRLWKPGEIVLITLRSPQPAP